MDRPGIKPQAEKWYQRLQIQLWLWAFLPLTLVLVAVMFTGVYGHQAAMHEFVAQRDTALAKLYARQIEDGLAHGTISADGAGLSTLIGDGKIARRGVVYVVDGAGRMLFYPTAGYAGRDLRANPAVQQALASTGDGSTIGQFAKDLPTHASYAAAGGAGWRVLVEEPVEDVVVPVLRFSSVLPIPIALAGLFSLGIIYLSVRTIVRPLQRLAEEATQVTGGDLTGLQEAVGGVEEIRYLHRALRDMVERIRHYQESMRDYIEGITQGQEAERARLSRELHDDTVQDLIAIGQRLQLAQRAMERQDGELAAESVRQTRDLCHRTLRELRRLIRALRPVCLEDLGFLPALEMLVQDVQKAGPGTEMLVHGEPRRLRPEVEMAAFRMAQEALANAVAHAKAQEIALTVHFGERELVLTVADDGSGFTVPDNPDTLTSGGHYGLLGMRERVRLAGGRLEIQSALGEGTRIIAHLPAEER